MYEKGLNYQFSVEEKRRKKAVSTDFYPGEGYNPITNPIPIAYKNPNVLRAMGKRWSISEFLSIEYSVFLKIFIIIHCFLDK